MGISVQDVGVDEEELKHFLSKAYDVTMVQKIDRGKVVEFIVKCRKRGNRFSDKRYSDESR